MVRLGVEMVAVIAAAFLRVGEYGVGFSDLGEALGCFRIMRIRIRVCSARKGVELSVLHQYQKRTKDILVLGVALLEICLRAVRLYFQDVVVVHKSLIETGARGREGCRSPRSSDSEKVHFVR